MSERKSCIDRAWQVLITCIRIEKRLIDLIVLKRHPRIIEKVNQSSEKINLPYTFIQERTKLRSKDFSLIKDIFIELFNPSANWKTNLEGIYDWRNIISHSHISLYRDYILYRPSGKRKKVNKLIKTHITSRSKNAAKPFQMSFRLWDDKKYKDVLKVLEEFDQVYLRHIAEQLGINYEKIR